MKTLVAGLSAVLLTALLTLACGTVSAEDSEKTFSQEELDQMMAPIALYPDSLLSQILMATTYPADIAEAVTWSKDNPDQKGDAAAEAVQDKSWDPSVMSLAAFPQVLTMMGEQPDWVRNVGDAFLAAPESVMDTVQQLRKRAKDEGNLESTEQQTVVTEQASSGQSVIIIEPADPQVVYVPTYNPTVIYGTWWWPAYRPYYYRPVGWAVATGVAWGIGIGVSRALWGGCNWGRSSVNINVNKYNSINVNRNKLSSNNRNSSWKHNSNNRRGVPYRDQNSRQKFDNKLGGANQRKDFRGRDADRAKASSTLKDRGIDPAKQRDKLKGSGGKEARDSVRKADRDVASGKLGDANRGKARDAVKTRDTGKTRDAGKARGAGKTRDAAKSMDRGQTGKASRDRNAGKSRDLSGRSSGSRSNALKGAGNAQKSNRNVSRGTSSNRSMRSHSGGNRSGGRAGGGGRRR